MEWLLALLQTLLASVVVVGALMWFLRPLATQYLKQYFERHAERLDHYLEATEQELNREVEHYKLSLQSVHTREMEQFRSALQRIAAEHEHEPPQLTTPQKPPEPKLDKLQEKRAEIIEELYKRLVEIERNTQYASTMLKESNQVFNEVKRSAVKNVFQSYKAFIKSYDENRIYFDEAFCLATDVYRDELFQASLEADTKLDMPEGRAQRDNFVEQSLRIWQEMDQVFLPIKKRLEGEFRTLVGINHSGTHEE